MRAAGDDQRVVGQRALGKANAAAFDVKARDLGHQHAHVAVAPEDGTERVSDLPGRQRAGRDLVREWLEEVEVAPIYDREVDRRTGKMLCRLQPTEPATDDNHPMPVR